MIFALDRVKKLGCTYIIYTDGLTYLKKLYIKHSIQNKSHYPF